MNDNNNNRYSSEDKPPQVPTHEVNGESISPSTSKSIHRSKTVRNLNSAGSKMKGLFKNKNKDSSEKQKKAGSSESSNRPVLTSSASFGPGDTHDRVVREDFKEFVMVSDKASSQEVEQRASQTASSADEFEQHEVQLELEKLNELIAQRTAEVQQEVNNRSKLEGELAEAQRVFKEREAEYSAIEHNFFEHTRAIRATDDDLSTIRDSFKLLKYSISRLIMTLNKKADKKRAADKFVQTWPALNILEQNGEMDPSLINPLIEKLVHEHLVKNIFSCPIYPGLKVNDAYSTLNNWLQAHSSQFSVRLRQQMAAVVAKSPRDSDIHGAAQAEKLAIAKKIYDDLADIYHPFLRENDAKVDEEKTYFHKVSDIVDKALKLTIAIRGQEVDISTVPIEEGKQDFDEQTMSEVKGKTAGLVRFCICPAFLGGDREHGFIEKGKVILSG